MQRSEMRSCSLPRRHICTTSQNIVATFRGIIFDTIDALILVECVLRGYFPLISRRLVPEEYPHLIQSGSIFIYDEHSSGIKRWTDGRSWSPSRVLDNFLVYRQVKKAGLSPTLDGSKLKSSTENHERDELSDTDSVTRTSPQRSLKPPEASMKTEPSQVKSQNMKQRDKMLTGSYVDDINCCKNGLVKKTMKIVVNGRSLHLVSYYTTQDAKKDIFQRPSMIPQLKETDLRPALFKQNFRRPISQPHKVLPRSCERRWQRYFLEATPGSRRIQLKEMNLRQPKTKFPLGSAALDNAVVLPQRFYHYIPQ